MRTYVHTYDTLDFGWGKKRQRNLHYLCGGIQHINFGHRQAKHVTKASKWVLLRSKYHLSPITAHTFEICLCIRRVAGNKPFDLTPDRNSPQDLRVPPNGRAVTTYNRLLYMRCDLIHSHFTGRSLKLVRRCKRTATHCYLKHFGGFLVGCIVGARWFTQAPALVSMILARVLPVMFLSFTGREGSELCRLRALNTRTSKEPRPSLNNCERQAAKAHGITTAFKRPCQMRRWYGVFDTRLGRGLTSLDASSSLE